MSDVRVPVNFADGKRTIRPAAPTWYIAGDMERAIVFEPGFDSGGRHYGVDGMNVRWLLRGPAGVTQFLLYTSWVPGRGERGQIGSYPMGADVGYHARVPQYEGQDVNGACEYLDGAPCYYDGSGLAAQDLFAAFLEQGEPAIWRALTDRYEDLAAVTS